MNSTLRLHFEQSPPLQYLALGILMQFSTPPPRFRFYRLHEFQERGSRVEKRTRKCLADVALSGSGVFIYISYYLLVFNSHPSVFFLAPREGECRRGELQAAQMLSVLMFFSLSPSSCLGSFSWLAGRGL